MSVFVFVQMLCSYVFMPVAFMMGIPYAESFTVAELIGTKLFLNEFVAYEKLSALKASRLAGIEEVIGGERQWISVRRPSPTTDFASYCHHCNNGFLPGQIRNHHHLRSLWIR